MWMVRPIVIEHRYFPRLKEKKQPPLLSVWSADSVETENHLWKSIDDLSGESADILPVLEEASRSMREKKAVYWTEIGQW